MNGASIKLTVSLGAPSSSWAIAATGDFNGDGMSDILWRDTAGNMVIWFMLMNGDQVYFDLPVGQVPTGWTIQGLNAD
jgi:hypothetical protein